MSEEKLDSKIVKKIVRENHLDFLYDLHKKGINIGKDNLEKLREAKLIEPAYSKKEREQIVNDTINKSTLNTNTDKSKKADSYIDIVSTAEQSSEYDIITSKELEERRKKYGHIFEGRTKPILRYEWMPVSTTEHTPEFIEWIDSINQRGFNNKTQYKPFNLYVQQAYQWLQENKTSADFDDDDEREEYRQEELRRCNDNALYFLNKYIWYKEGNAEDESGRIKYIAAPAHEFLAYMDDCNYSMGIAKGRQMAATTTIMSLNVRKVVFKQNYFTKFITEDDEKAVEIFDDKLKYAFSELPDWMRPDVLNERDNLFKIGKRGEAKGVKEGVGSSIRVVPPKRTAIAGGAPQEVMIDEAGNIKILDVMIGNARPTMLFFDPKTGKLKLKRRLVFWGTGGNMSKGGKAFETELMAIFKDWDERKFKTGIVPIFFNWHCRPGATQEIYDSEKEVAYGKAAENSQDPDSKQHITEFHQTWPNTITDVFRASAKTLVDDEYIEQSLERIRLANQDTSFTLHQYGYFEPVFDYNQPMPEGSFVDYKIIGSNFIPTSDLDPRASTTIFFHPQREWSNRYMAGVDPIDTNSGLSKFSSTIWDRHEHVPAAILNFRVPDYQSVFLQSLLLSLYYDHKEVKTGIKELIESNRGTAYYQFLTFMGYGKECVLNYELPFYIQNKSTINEGVGIDNKGVRNEIFVNKMSEMFKIYGQNFYHSILFEQLKTFTCTVSDKGKAVWGPINIKYFRDDALWSCTFSYICGEMCFPELVPTNLEKQKSNIKVIYKLVRDKNNKLKYQAIRVSA